MDDPLKGDDHRAALVTLRDILADHMRQADSNVAAQVAARLQAVLAEIAALPKPEASSADDRAKRVAGRLPGANVATLAGRRRQHAG